MENRQQFADESSEKCRISPGISKLECPLPSLSNPSMCFLVHFELTAFWLHPDLLVFFEHTLQGWLALETLVLEDNALGFLSSPGREFINTLSFLCTKGRLQFLQITNNPVNDEFARLLFEKLVAAFRRKCKNRGNNARSLTKLKFSSHQVSPAAAVYLGRAIRDVCVCKLSSTQSAARILESVSSKSDSSTENKDITACSCMQPGCSEQKYLCIGGCVSCDQTSACDNVQEPQVRTEGNATLELHIIGNKKMCGESSEDSSQDKKPLPITVRSSNTFAAIQVLKLRCVVGERGARLIADGLQRNSTLYSLSLANCDINSAGLASIFQALSGNRYVRQLCVKGNHYDPSNNDSLAEMLASNNTLTDLNLGTCDLRGLSEKMISALCVNNTLTSLKLARNGLRKVMQIFLLCLKFSLIQVSSQNWQS
ncbi:uncharacterized protein LOC110041768 isoform X2 [Orbicella faveolata]|uniref:uncharacterized protein LOC110041768 isoform X2 n=1 Tax=Orbicella faveolata TaxID=48498 RepID=UPI0009E1E8A2|nr:uncharacterized protein LOC110041768 isoform X2 [Orbicella faveolata]